MIPSSDALDFPARYSPARMLAFDPGTAPVQRRVQFVALLQIAEHGSADRATTALVCPGTERRDLEAALAYLLDDGSIHGPSWRLESLVTLAERGLLSLTVLGRLRLDQDDV